MVNALGFYQLSDMRDRVRRLLNSTSITVDQNTGAELSSVIQDQGYSNTDLVNQINESLTAIYTEMIVGRESLFALTDYLSTTIYNPGPYALPPGLVQLRWLKWKDPSIALDITPGTSATNRSINWYPMVMVDDAADYALQEGAYDAPTWRWEGGEILLNTVIAQANQNGIMFNYVALPSELVNDTDIISVPQFVRIAQQAVIYDVAYTLAFSKDRLVPPELAKKRDEWHQRLMTMVENAYNVQSLQLVAPQRMVRGSYSGRYMRVISANR